MTTIDSKAAMEMVHQWWEHGADGKPETGILQQLKDYITIPNQSPAYDPEVLTNGHQDRAVQLMVDWARAQAKFIKGLSVEVKVEKGRTPVIVCTVPGTDSNNQETVLMYGHMDKQPPMDGWMDGLGPHTPVVRDGKLYGRGGADDGYAIFASLNSLAILQAQNIPHARIVLVIEASEESGSDDLPFYLESMTDVLGKPSLVICLDSGCGNYDQLWLTTSLRGMAMIDVEVRMLSEGVHSGSASGIVPSTFRVIRQLLDRIENPMTGELPPIMYADIPEAYQKFAHLVADTVGDTVYKKFPFLPNAGPMIDGQPPKKDDLAKLLLKATWEPTISYTGIEGAPALGNAGNVLRPYTGIRLSIRLPPTVQPAPVIAHLQKELTRDPPYGATVKVHCEKGDVGWAAPVLAPWLHNSVEAASQSFYNKGYLCHGEGGSIPFMAQLGAKFPGTQFVVTGVLGPASNAHGPNEFLHIEMAQKLTCCVANVLADHSKQFSK